jgi:hypothetical protein
MSALKMEDGDLERQKLTSDFKTSWKFYGSIRPIRMVCGEQKSLEMPTVGVQSPRCKARGVLVAYVHINIIQGFLKPIFRPLRREQGALRKPRDKVNRMVKDFARRIAGAALYENVLGLPDL